MCRRDEALHLGRHGRDNADEESQGDHHKAHELHRPKWVPLQESPAANFKFVSRRAFFFVVKNTLSPLLLYLSEDICSSSSEATVLNDSWRFNTVTAVP